MERYQKSHVYTRHLQMRFGIALHLLTFIGWFVKKLLKIAMQCGKCMRKWHVKTHPKKTFKLKNLVRLFLQRGLDVLLARDEGHGLRGLDVAFLESTQFVFLVGQVGRVPQINLQFNIK